MKQQTNLDLTEGPIFRKLVQFTIPLLLGRIISLLYGMADTIMMGQITGTTGMAAVSAAGAPLNWIGSAFTATAVGVNVICGTLRGARDEDRLQECMHSCISMGFLLGVVQMIVSALGGIPLFYLTNVPKEIFSDCTLYYYVRIVGFPLSLCGAYSRNILIANGNTKFPALLGLISGVLNVILNAVFIPLLGATGAALATITCQAIDFVVLMLFLFTPQGGYCLKFRNLKLKLIYAKQILSVGIPASVNSIVFSLSNAPLQAAVNSFGPAAVAGKAAATTIGNYIGTVQNTFADSALNATAQCYGARKFKRICKVATIASFGSSGIIIGIAAIFTLFAQPLLQLINPDPAAVEAGIPYLLFFSWGSVIYTITVTLSACLRGIKKATQATIYTAASVIIPRLLWVWLLVPHLETPLWLYAIYPLSWLISAVTLTIVFLHHRKNLLADAPFTTL